MLGDVAHLPCFLEALMRDRHPLLAGRDLEQMGGLLRRMPWTGLFFLIGCLSIAALPPCLTSGQTNMPPETNATKISNQFSTKKFTACGRPSTRGGGL
jgi:hypothetical protein